MWNRLKCWLFGHKIIKVDLLSSLCTRCKQEWGVECIIDDGTTFVTYADWNEDGTKYRVTRSTYPAWKEKK